MDETSYNYSYVPTVDHRENNLFREEYYSSTDTKIYFDDAEQTEIAFIQYDIQEQLKPIYGYNSRTFDDVVIGNRIVTGQFSVPIKNTAKQVFIAERDNNNIITDADNSNTIEDYNNSEKEKLYATEWFGTTAKNISNQNNSINDADSEYITKLIALDKYGITAYSSSSQFRNAILSFQKEHNLSNTGILNEVTKSQIDEEFNELNAEAISLNYYTGYSDLSMTKNGVELHGNGIVLQRLTVDDQQLTYVMDNEGKKYYIKE